jgi:hypothetical protein
MQAMAHRHLQPRHTVGVAVALLLLLLVQSAFGFPFRQTRANLSPRMFYRNFGSLVGVVLTESRHIVGSFETLYELRQLAVATSQTEESSGSISLNSQSHSPAQVVVCDYRAAPAQSGIGYRCPASGRGGNRFSSIPRC